MTDSPYKPPAAHVADRDAGHFSIWLALAAGCAGYGAIFVVWTLTMPVWQQYLLGGGIAINEINRALFADAVFNGYRLALLAAAGLIAGVLAVRYTAGRPYLHAIVGTLPIYAVFIGRYFSLYGNPFPVWSELLGLLLPVPLALLGARLQLQRPAAPLPGDG